mmetsp:Transcript_7623/g.23557  ORF Transcript_7623/g.23557 Transcript_7623/m.23557 type:complete len:217 (+) Transcript_7623:586-1236(+)
MLMGKDAVRQRRTEAHDGPVEVLGVLEVGGSRAGAIGAAAPVAVLEAVLRLDVAARRTRRPQVFAATVERNVVEVFDAGHLFSAVGEHEPSMKEGRLCRRRCGRPLRSEGPVGLRRLRYPTGDVGVGVQRIPSLEFVDHAVHVGPVDDEMRLRHVARGGSGRHVAEVHDRKRTDEHDGVAVGALPVGSSRGRPTTDVGVARRRSEVEIPSLYERAR